MGVDNIKAKIQGNLSNAEDMNLEARENLRLEKVHITEQLNKKKESKSTISKIRDIPVLGFIVWWVYMILKTPEKINELFAETNKIKSLEENIAKLSSKVYEIQRSIEPDSLEENLVVDTEPYSDSICLAEDSTSRLDEDVLYLSFENVFRGSENDILGRQQKYASYSLEAYNNTGKYFLDVGCGRGEFLKILKGVSVSAKGLDVNSVSCEKLKTDGFEVECVDVNTYLEGLDDNTLSGVSAFQLIEHLTQDDLKKFIALAFKKTAQGGVIVLETVNAKCISSLSNFYLDLSHKKPLPCELMKFLLEYYNFKDIKIVYSSPCVGDLRVKRLSEFNYMDYAVIGWKR